MSTRYWIMGLCFATHAAGAPRVVITVQVYNAAGATRKIYASCARHHA